ncbi:type II toxin-antitoxin system RelE/ParE family toxin [Pelagibius sp. CAU 1746]|uniref:type II toxin-antitoxin system RelE/ParE family toxin n=1 Tax=Pelagibius sp. CAU 1746 TaxID=3140370 RepID=UPI00325B3717
MAGYKLSQAAKSDLREIYRYGLLEYGETQADRYFADFFARFEQIAETPLLYPAVDHIREGYRRGVCGVHSIYYRIDNDTVEIMRLLGRQDTTEAF